jgi:hypothetical protein
MTNKRVRRRLLVQIGHLACGWYHPSQVTEGMRLYAAQRNRAEITADPNDVPVAISQEI